MTSNNLEAIELLKITKRHIQDGYEASAEALVEKAIELLQADEDIEVKEQAFRCICNDCPIHGKTTPYEKPTKGTRLDKLKDLQDRIDDMEAVLAEMFEVKG